MSATAVPKTRATKKSKAETDTRARFDFTPEDFVFVWTTSNSAEEAADRLGKIAKKPVPVGVVQCRASAYRAKGVNLKKMKAGREPLNVASLNALIAEKSATPALAS